MFKTTFQFAFCIAIIFRTASFAGKISLEDEEVDIPEFSEFTSRERPRYQLSRESRKDGEKLPEVACLPHPEVVQVEPSVTDERNTPQFVMVNRCKGACDLPLKTESCTPIKTRIILVLVTSTNGASATRFVEEHLACACECKTTCLYNNHYLDEKTCRCNCTEKCKEGENQDTITCACAARAGKRREEILEY